MDRETDIEERSLLAETRANTVARDLYLYYTFKRAIDVVLSFVALILLSPILLLIAIAIRLDSPGPVIFAQKRIGSVRRMNNGNLRWEQAEFTFYKFRTMIDKADSTIHQTFIQALIKKDELTIRSMLNSDIRIKKLVNDPRITRLGHFLRRTSLDELPQFWNVLMGEMSLIGPRPAIPYEVEMYKPWYFRRFEATPGLTGLWQVKARSSADFDEMVRLDIEYVENQSFWLDIKILFMTPVILLIHRCAA